MFVITSTNALKEVVQNPILSPPMTRWRSSLPLNACARRTTFSATDGRCFFLGNMCIDNDGEDEKMLFAYVMGHSRHFPFPDLIPKRPCRL